jgi:hypothetical protein
VRIRHGFAAGTLAATMLLAACSNTTELPARAQRQLQAGLDEVQAAVAAADRFGARSALRDLERAVATLGEDGQIDDARAQEILDAARAVGEQLSLLPAPEPSPSPTLTPPPSPSSEPTSDPGEEPRNGDEQGNDNGNGNGNAYGHDEDHGGGND